MSYAVIDTRDSAVRRRWLGSARVALTCRNIFTYLHAILLFNKEEQVHDSTLDSRLFSWSRNSLLRNTVFHQFTADHLFTWIFFTWHSSVILSAVAYSVQTVQPTDSSCTFIKSVIYRQTHFKHTESGCHNCYLTTLQIAKIYRVFQYESVIPTEKAP